MLGLALSGGGFRATLFHLGSLLRLNEAGLLSKIDEFTSVSGGSIISAWLGVSWNQLQFDSSGVATNLDEVIIKPVREFCGRTIDVGIILGGIINPIRHPSNLLINNYRKHLFGDKTLQDLPASPRFTIYATSLQTGASVRFTREYLGDYHLGEIKNPEILIAQDVASSSAFPPPLCPVKVECDPDAWVKDSISDLHDDEYLKKVMWLGDGGIYDNLGLERLSQRCDRILVSDAGAPFGVDGKMKATRFSQLARTKRTLDIMSAQVRALRTRQLIRQFVKGEKSGAYWGIGTQISEFPMVEKGLGTSLMTDGKTTREIAGMRTRLNKFNGAEQTKLINWGYALADAALRSRYDSAIAASAGLPLPDNLA
ncbi:MAG: patatin-like phospholipase family protein [Xanthomonadales bacterium]|nr:patatin-like phospholipase family protein [Xanthomonadales bacterium]